MKINAENERMKRKYFEYCLKAHGYSEKTISQIERTLNQWDEFNKNVSYKEFSGQAAMDFKHMLQEAVDKDKLRPNTVKVRLKYLQKFFHWLRLHPGYKSKIKPLVIDILTPTRKLNIQENNYFDKPYPTLQQVQNICNSIDINTIIDERNRVIFATLLLTGMRLGALSTFSLGCFDLENLIFDQDPRKKVKTKNGKRIVASAIRFDEKMAEYIINWYQKLLGMGYGINDPFIPGVEANRLDGLCFSKSIKLNKNFIKTGRFREIIKEYYLKHGYLDFTPHSLRHAHIALAMKYAKTAEDIKAISENIGHANIDTTLKCYAHLTQSQIKSTISKLNLDLKKL
jgi:integrase